MTTLSRRSVLRNSLAVAAAGTMARPYLANAAATTVSVWWPQGFIREEDVTRAFEVLESGDWQYVFPATTFAYPVFRTDPAEERRYEELLRVLKRRVV